MMIDRLLLASTADAKTVSPASISCAWADFPEDRVRKYLATAVRVAQIASQRLESLHDSSTKKIKWNNPMAPEHFWFGDYSEIKIDKVRRTFRGIVRHLSSPRLKVVCDASRTTYGDAWPAIEKITVGGAWHDPGKGSGDDGERVQTFVHEASHICGRVSAAEANSYGRYDAQKLSLWRMRATRNADNYGYYALDVLDWPTQLLA